MKQNCGAQWQDPAFHNYQTYKQQQKIWEVRKGWWKVLSVFSSRSYTHTHTHTHTHQLYVQNVTPATENFVVHATIIVENRTQNYCAQAVLKCVQNAGLSDKKLH